MSWLDRFERRFSRFAIPNPALWIVAGQIVLFVICTSDPAYWEKISLIPRNVLGGEYWRLITFPFQPVSGSPIWLFFALYMFYFMGRVLEQSWGTLRFNVFLLVGYLSTVGASFVFPAVPATNGFIGTSVFLAFGYLFPDFVIRIYFVLPVRIRWLALITWLFYGFKFTFGDWPTRLLILSSVANFLLFFGSDIWRRAVGGERQMRTQLQRMAGGGHAAAFHTCRICGVTDKSDPGMEFRYCSKCAGTPCYCANHIHDHEHLVDAQTVS